MMRRPGAEISLKLCHPGSSESAVYEYPSKQYERNYQEMRICSEKQRRDSALEKNRKTIIGEKLFTGQETGTCFNALHFYSEQENAQP